MQNKDLIIIVLVIVLIYLYYQNRKQNTLTNFAGSTVNLEEIAEVKKVNKIMAEFCKNEIGGKDIQEIRTKLNGRTLAEILEENEDYETTVDELKRKKGELEADLSAQATAFQNRLREKDREIKKFKEDLGSEKQQHKGSLGRITKLTEQITDLQEDLKVTKQREKYKIEDFRNWFEANKEKHPKLEDFTGLYLNWEKVIRGQEKGTLRQELINEWKSQIDKG